MIVKFGKKFTALHLDEVIAAYWDRSKNIPANETVFFDLQEIEWIALEEITFLFGWFRFLILNDKKIKILLPAFNSDFKTHNQLVNLWGKWKIFSFMNLLETGTKMTDYFNVDISVNRIINSEELKDEYNQEDFNEDITVVPFQHISTYGYGSVTSIDDLVVKKIHKPLNLAKQVYEVLEKHTSISAKDNLLLSKIVTNELFLNVLHHSFQTNGDTFDECYFAISLKRQLSVDNVIKRETLKRIHERKKVTRENFYEAKKRIETISLSQAESRLNYLISTVLPQGYESERLPETLAYFREKDESIFDYRNENFIEFTFLDFGQGIPGSLKGNYLSDFEDDKIREKIFSELGPLHSGQNIDTRVLEYAFLMNSSRHPFDLEIQNEYEVPRGLYYLIDIVRRHNGLIVARSRRGRVIYDFSSPRPEIREAVIYASNDSSLPDFQGTMISIVIPADLPFEELQGAARPPYQLPDKIINRPAHYFSLVDLLGQIGHSDHSGHFKTSLQDYYKSFFDKISEVFYNYKSGPCLLIFDCIGLDIFPIKHKLLFYFASSPNVNRLTSVVLLNFFDLDILQDVRSSIRYRLTKSGEANYIYKPVPVINSDQDIIWLAVSSDEDEKLLTELLRYEDHFISKSDLLDFKSYQDTFFDVDKFGNITAKIPTQDMIIQISKENGKK